MTSEEQRSIRQRAREFSKYIVQISASPKEWKEFCEEVERDLKLGARMAMKQAHTRQAKRLFVMAASFKSLSFFA